MLSFFEGVSLEVRQQLAVAPRDEQGYLLVNGKPGCLLRSYMRVIDPDSYWGVTTNPICTVVEAAYAKNGASFDEYAQEEQAFFVYNAPLKYDVDTNHARQASTWFDTRQAESRTFDISEALGV